MGVTQEKNEIEEAAEGEHVPRVRAEQPQKASERLADYFPTAQHIYQQKKKDLKLDCYSWTANSFQHHTGFCHRGQRGG